MSASNGIRESAKRATRDALIEAALAEFFAHGFDGPSLDAICARASLSGPAVVTSPRDRMTGPPQ